MTLTLTGLTVNGMRGFQLSRIANVVHLETAHVRYSIPVRNLNLVAFQRIRYVVFLVIAAICLALTWLATLNPRPALGEYELADWYWWALAAIIALILYFVVSTGAIVVHSGSSRTVLSGKAGMTRQAFEAFQP
ncbi:hypothetical protein [Deinococcus alpinitundrae]|uniref:hypothetical protein n=1 Tax=Deinococcus alpinitundrae TaxID=468913 RepID=UPI00137A059C|nr:hypothetical protein [Deinococcus alpinitundrae]